MTDPLVLVIPELPKLQAGIMQKYKRSTYRKRWHRLVWEAVMESGQRPSQPWERAALVMVRHASNRQPDRGNVAGSWKPIEDGLTRAGIIADDAPDVLLIQSSHWVHCRPADARVEITIVGLDDGDDLSEVAARIMPEEARFLPCAQCGVAPRDPSDG